MMKEKYESLPLSELRQVAKARGLKGISTLRKEQLVERMLQEDEKEKTEKPKRQTRKQRKSQTDLNGQTEGKAVR